MSFIQSQFIASEILYVRAITTVPNGNIYIQGDPSGQKLYVYNPAGSLLFTIPSLNDVYNSFFTDSINNKIYCAGVASFGILDISTNTFVNYPSVSLNGITYDATDGYVYATTSVGYSVKKINTSTGAISTMFSANNNVQVEEYGSFFGCAVDTKGSLYCITQGLGYMYKFVPVSTYKLFTGVFSILNSNYGNPLSLICDPTTNCIYTSTTGGTIYKTSTTTTISTVFYNNDESNVICYDTQRNRLVIAGRNSNNIYISHPTNLTLNIQNSNLLYYYKFNSNLLNYQYEDGISDASTSVVTISWSSTVLIYGNWSLYLPGNNTQLFKLPPTTFTPNGITIAFWMICASTPISSTRLFDFGNGLSSNNFYVDFSANGAMQLGILTPSIGIENVYSLNYSISDVKWHHYAIMLSSTGELTFYVDGNVIITGINQNIYPYLSQMTDCYFGRSPYMANGYLNAYVNRFVVFNRKITRDELYYLSNTTNNITITNKVTGGVQLTNDYTIVPSKIVYGSSSKVRLQYSNQNLITNSYYVLKTGSTILDTKLYKGYYILTGYNVDYGSSAIDNSGNLWIYGVAPYGAGQYLYIYSDRLDSVNRTVSFPKNQTNMPARLRYYNGFMYYMSCNGWHGGEFGEFGVYNINDSSFVRWQINNYYADMVIDNDGFGYAMSGTWASTVKSVPALYQWIVDKINLQTFETTRVINGTATMFEGSNDNTGGPVGIAMDSFEDLYILTKSGYLTKWSKYGTQLLLPVRLSYLNTFILNGRIDCDKYTNTLYIIGDYKLYAINTTTFVIDRIFNFPFTYYYNAQYPCIDNNYRNLYCPAGKNLFRFDLNPTPTIAFDATLTNVTSNTLQISDLYGNEIGIPINITGDYPCFLQGSKILRLNLDYDEEEYVAVESLRKGDLVKTATCGYKSVAFIGRATLHRPADDQDHQKRLYVFSKPKCPKVFKDLCITGEHCVLYRPGDVSIEKLRQVRKHMGDNFITEDFHRVPACLDERATPYKGDGPVTIWHFALEHNNLHNNYAVYANGLLVETCSIHYLTKRSNMQLV